MKLCTTLDEVVNGNTAGCSGHAHRRARAGRNPVANAVPTRDTGVMDGGPDASTLMPAEAQAVAHELVDDVSPAGSAFPPIADYGFLSDCETIALVAPGGSIEW